MKTFVAHFSKLRTEKFWVEDVADTVVLSQVPRPRSLEIWLNGERMTGVADADIQGKHINVGPLRVTDTIIISYETEDTR